MGTPFKMAGFSGFKESPVKGKGDNLKRIMTENKIAAKIAGTWYKTGTQSTMPKNFNMTGSSKAGKFIKWAGGKLAGTLGLLGAGTLSATAGNVSKKSEGEQIKNLLTKHKLKGGNN